MTHLQPPRLAVHDVLRLKGATFAALFCALTLLAAMPVVFTDTLPLVDYHNHLARMHILAELTASAALQRYYEADWTALPNLAMDLAVPVLAKWMPVTLAGKLFVVVTLWLLAGGVAVLHRVLFGQWSAWCLLAFLLLFSRSLLWGLINYLFGIGVCLLAFAAWIALRERHWMRFGCGTAMALGLFFAHLMAFGFYAILMIGYEAGMILRERPPTARALQALFLAGATLLPSLAVLFLLTPGGGGGPWVFNHLGHKFDLLFTVFDNYNTAFDAVCFTLAILATVLAFWKRWVRVHPAMAVPLALVFLAYLAMPTVAATSSGADQRVPVFLGLLLVAVSHWAAPNVRLARAFVGCALAMFVLRLGVVETEWRGSDRTFAELLQAMDGIPRGSRIAIASPPFKWEATPLHHFPTLAVLRRDAFVPTLFASPTQQPVALRPHYRALADKLGEFRLWQALVERTALLDADESAALAEYNYLIFISPKPFTVPQANEITPVFIAPRFVLARLDNGAGPMLEITSR